jgi:hypothetical protein
MQIVRDRNAAIARGETPPPMPHVAPDHDPAAAAAEKARKAAETEAAARAIHERRDADRKAAIAGSHTAISLPRIPDGNSPITKDDAFGLRGMLIGFVNHAEDMIDAMDRHFGFGADDAPPTAAAAATATEPPAPQTPAQHPGVTVPTVTVPGQLPESPAAS